MVAGLRSREAERVQLSRLVAGVLLLSGIAPADAFRRRRNTS
jgi:hypothetical protein